jgi:hypothetical protein
MMKKRVLIATVYVLVNTNLRFLPLKNLQKTIVSVTKCRMFPKNHGRLSQPLLFEKENNICQNNNDGIASFDHYRISDDNTYLI